MRAKYGKTPPLDVKFDGDLQQLGFFLAHLLTYMQEYGQEIPTKDGKLRSITLVLEGATGCWMVTFHNANALELRNFNHLMMMIRRRFEDLLADRKARDHIKTMNQGRRVRAEYTEEFHDLVCNLNDRPEDILISCFKDGLNNNW